MASRPVGAGAARIDHPHSHGWRFETLNAWALTQPDYAPAARNHVQIHLDAALSRRQAVQGSEEGQERRGDDAARTGGDRFAGQPGNGRGQKTG
jgi:hypothetical protein